MFPLLETTFRETEYPVVQDRLHRDRPADLLLHDLSHLLWLFRPSRHHALLHHHGGRPRHYMFPRGDKRHFQPTALETRQSHLLCLIRPKWLGPHDLRHRQVRLLRSAQPDMSQIHLVGDPVLPTWRYSVWLQITGIFVDAWNRRSVGQFASDVSLYGCLRFNMSL